MSNHIIGDYRGFEYVGTLQSTGTSANSKDATGLGTTSGLPPGDYLLQCDAAGSFAQVASGTATVAATNGIELAADEKVKLRVGQRLRFLAWISGAGTTNLRVFRVHD